MVCNLYNFIHIITNTVFLDKNSKYIISAFLCYNQDHRL